MHYLQFSKYSIYSGALGLLGDTSNRIDENIERRGVSNFTKIRRINLIRILVLKNFHRLQEIVSPFLGQMTQRIHRIVQDPQDQQASFVELIGE